MWLEVGEGGLVCSIATTQRRPICTLICAHRCRPTTTRIDLAISPHKHSPTHTHTRTPTCGHTHSRRYSRGCSLLAGRLQTHRYTPTIARMPLMENPICPKATIAKRFFNVHITHTHARTHQHTDNQTVIGTLAAAAGK